MSAGGRQGLGTRPSRSLSGVFFSLTVLVGLLVYPVPPGLAIEQEPPPAQGLTLFVFDCGSVDIKDISVFSPGYDVGQSRTLVVPCYLVKHPRGLLFWDAGLSDSLAPTPPEGVPFGSNMRLHVRKTLAKQLEELQVSPAEIRFVAFSHMHFDHVGNANLFTSSILLIQEAEYRAAFGSEAERSVSSEVAALYAKLKDNETQQLKGDHDVFGDGSVMLLAAPGHTPGHQVLFLKLPKRGAVVLSGDLYHFAKNRERRLLPSFNFDRDLSYNSIDTIEAFLVRSGASLWIQHDPEQYARIPRAPTPIQ